MALRDIMRKRPLLKRFRGQEEEYLTYFENIVKLSIDFSTESAELVSDDGKRYPLTTVEALASVRGVYTITTADADGSHIYIEFQTPTAVTFDDSNQTLWIGRYEGY